MASTYLTRTPASSGTLTTWTLSCWVKKSKIADYQTLLAGNTTSTDNTGIFFNNTDELQFWHEISSSVNINLKTNAKYRDTSAWYHVVFKFDSTQSTEADRLKIYVNGIEQSYTVTTSIGSSETTFINDNQQQSIGGKWGQTGTSYLDGSLTHYHFIDGTAYDASAFGETDSLTGIWKPKTAPSVTYGTNGFFLKFENSGSMGTDSSGNANNFTVNGTLTQTLDTPSNVLCTLNPLVNIEGSYTLSNGNTKFTGTGSNDNCAGTLGVTQGKWYFETKWTANVATAFAGWTTQELVSAQGTGNLITKFVGQYRDDYTINFGTTGTTNTSVSANDIFGFYLDLDSATKTCKIYQNDVLIATENIPTARIGEAFTPVVGDTSATNGIIECNFGNGYFGSTAVSSSNADANGEGLFEYDPTLSSVNYLTLNTKNMNAQEYS